MSHLPVPYIFIFQSGELRSKEHALYKATGAEAGIWMPLTTSAHPGFHAQPAAAVFAENLAWQLMEPSYENDQVTGWTLWEQIETG